MPILAKSLLFMLTLAATMNSWGAGNEQAEVLYLRPAASKEILGVWSARFTGSSFYHFRYVAIMADGRIGWAVSNTEPSKLNHDMVIEAINKKEILDGLITGWEPYTAVDGRLTADTEHRGTKEYFTIQVLTANQGSASQRTYIPGAPGDLVMQQFYQIPRDWQGSAPPHMLTPAPLILRTVTE